MCAKTRWRLEDAQIEKLSRFCKLTSLGSEKPTILKKAKYSPPKNNFWKIILSLTGTYECPVAQGNCPPHCLEQTFSAKKGVFEFNRMPNSRPLLYYLQMHRWYVWIFSPLIIYIWTSAMFSYLGLPTHGLGTRLKVDNIEFTLWSQEEMVMDQLKELKPRY